MKTKSKIIAFMLAVTLIFSGSFVPANEAGNEYTQLPTNSNASITLTKVRN